MALNLQDLEDFAEGRGAGAFSPQQGSMLPAAAPTRQGGLPLGMAPSTIAAPVTSASFGPPLPAMPMPTGTPPGMPPGLPPGPPPGLPLAPPPPPGLPGMPLGSPGMQLGGQQPSMALMLQQALAQANTPRQWGQGEGIGNVLQSIGAGLQGQKPTWMGQEAEEMERRQKAMQIGLQMRQLDQQDTYQQAQMKQMGMQTKLLGAQAYEHGAKVLDWLGERIDDKDLSPEQRAKIIASASPMLSEMFSAGAAGDPDREALARDPAFIESLLTAGGSKAKNFLAGYPLLDANGQRVVGSLVKAKKYDEAIKVAKELSNDAAATTVNGLVPQWQRVVENNPRLLEAIQSGKHRVTLNDALDVVKATPEQRAAVDLWMRNQKPEYVDSILGSAGIESPFAEEARRKEFGKARASAQGKESTIGGQTDIAATRATTEKTIVDTKLAPYKTIPGQGGAMTYIDVGGRGPAVPGAGGGIPVGPVPNTPTTQGATAGQLSTTPGTQLSPNVSIVARTPLPGMSVEAAKDIRVQEGVSRDLRLLYRLTEGGGLNSYIGPTLTGARATEWWKKNAPEMLAGGKVPDALAVMDSVEANLKNLKIRDVTGAAVRIDEEPRILAEVPDRTRDKPEVYRAKLAYQIEVQKIISQRTKALLGPDGLLRLDVDADEVARRFPLPGSNQNVDLSGGVHRGNFK
jgi:hypothetical protein